MGTCTASHLSSQKPIGQPTSASDQCNPGQHIIPQGLQPTQHAKICRYDAQQIMNRCTTQLPSLVGILLCLGKCLQLAAMLAQPWCGCGQFKDNAGHCLASAVLQPRWAARLASSNPRIGCHQWKRLEIGESVLTGVSSTLGILLPSTSMSCRARLHTAGTMGCILSCSRRTASAKTISSKTLPAAQQHQCLTVETCALYWRSRGMSLKPCTTSRASQSCYLVKQM